VNIIYVKEKLIDAGGKKFASKVGFILFLILTIASFLQLPEVVYAIGGMLVLFATLESVLAYCVGCKVYALFSKFW
jgi:predicted membrane channel-forming protein YqfA (hemolysin III family)